jgi:hypothetical protein
LLERLVVFLVAIGFCRFAGAGAISAFGFPYFVILMRSPRTARSSNSSNLFFRYCQPNCQHDSLLLQIQYYIAVNRGNCFKHNRQSPSHAFILGLETEA